MQLTSQMRSSLLWHKMTSRYLIYALVDPRDGQWRYIGKSVNWLARPYAHYSERRRCAPKDQWVRCLEELGLFYEVEVLEYLPSEQGLDEAEREWIAAARRVGAPLTNLTAGGRRRRGRG
jgi:hypothetical protein